MSEKRTGDGLIIIAHRGARSLAPENTMAAFDKAVELGAPWIELDVQWHDGQLWVFHDDRLERTTNGTGRLSEHTSEALRALDAGNGERIPELGDVIERLDRRARLNIEMKSGGGTASAVADLLAGHIDRGWPAEDFLVSSFILPQLREFRQRMPAVPVGVLLCGVPLDLAACASELGARYLNVDREFADPALIADAKGRGLRVLAYTVNEPEDARRLVALGVDGIFTDYPQRFLPG